jgi:hypothetical protein
MCAALHAETVALPASLNQDIGVIGRFQRETPSAASLH